MIPVAMSLISTNRKCYNYYQPKGIGGGKGGAVVPQKDFNFLP